MIAFAISTANIILVWIAKPWETAKKNHEGLRDEVREALKAHDRRLQKVEGELSHLPTKDDLHSLSLKVEAIHTELETVTRTTRRIDDYLRENNK